MRIPPPIYAVTLGILIWFSADIFPSVEVIRAPLTLLGWPVIVLGVGVEIAAFTMFWTHRTTLDPIHPVRATSLVQLGPYRFSRNPMYLGLVLVLVGLTWLRGVPACWLLVAFFVWLISTTQIRPEELALQRNFGDNYVRYMNTVPRWFAWRRRR